MFRAQQNAFDDAIAKATDENLTSENWELILDVCDRVSAEDSGAKDAVASMIKRLAHRNANVQLYTLELANSLSQNCGSKVHTELASRSFTDALLRLANDRNTHQQVKAKILERLGEWTDMFSKDPDLGIMGQAYNKLKSQNPNLHPPSKPTKRQITSVDREKEEEELQMALALSIKDKASREQAAAKKANHAGPSTAAGPSSQKGPVPQPVPSGTTAATVSRVRALYDFQPSEPGELQFRKGDIIAVLASAYKDWWNGSLKGQTGIFPLNYVEKLSDPTQEELQREAQMEAEVFAEIKNVEKLLTLLSTSSSELNVKDNEEITALYHSTLAIRPKLIELIGKYSQKKDDFTQLNEKFIKARRDYESLLEASMSQPMHPQYNRQGPQQAYGYAGPGYPSTAGRPYPSAPSDSYTPKTQQHLPQNGPLPFFVSGNQSISGNVPPDRIPSAAQPPPPAPSSSSDPYHHHHHRPQSTYDNPQELSTSHYASPTDNRPQSYPGPSSEQPIRPSQNDDYSPSVYSVKEGGGPSSHSNAEQPHSQPQQFPPYSHVPTYQHPPQTPNQQPLQATGANAGQAPYPMLGSSSSSAAAGGPPPPPAAAPPSPAGGYQPYHAPPAHQQPAYTGDAGSNPNDFYR